MQTHIITTLEELNALGAAWDGIAPSSSFPMQHFIWMQGCAASFTREGELRVVVVEDGQETVAIAPLVHRKGSPYLEMLGVTELHEPTDIIAADPHTLAPLAGAIADLDVPLYLRRVPAESLLPNAMVSAFRRRGMLFCRKDSSWPWITLDPGWAEPESRLNSGRRSDFRRAARIAAEMGAVTSEVLSPTPQTLAPILEEAFAVEAAGWKGETKSAMALDPVRGDFYRRYATAACEKGILRLCFLRIGGKSAAMQLAVESGGRFCLLKIGFDKRFARASPGNLLVRESLRYAALKGLASYDFLGTAEPWIRMWTTQEKSCIAIRGYPLGLGGVKTLTRDLVKTAWHKLRPSRST